MIIKITDENFCLNDIVKRLKLTKRLDYKKLIIRLNEGIYGPWIEFEYPDESNGDPWEDQY
jgi:hypothetical protein